MAAASLRQPLPVPAPATSSSSRLSAASRLTLLPPPRPLRRAGSVRATRIRAGGLCPRSSAAAAVGCSSAPEDKDEEGETGLAPVAVPEQKGGRMVAELIGAFNELTERMGGVALSTSSSRLLFKSLKLSIPLLQPLPFGPDGRAPLARALSVASLLADLQMDAEVISASLLRVGLDVGVISMRDVKSQVGTSTAHLLHENLRMSRVSSTVEMLDNETASSLRKFCLTYYDIRAMVLEIVLKLDRMRHLDYLPRYNQQMLGLEALQIYAPLAHTIGAGALSLELEDLSFRYLFPYSYLYVDTWLRSHETVCKPSLKTWKELLYGTLQSDPEMQELVDDIAIKGRYKSRFSTMKKILRDGRTPEEVNDLLGLRIILNPRPESGMQERGQRACYRVRDIVQSLWKEIPTRTKDYISKPKANGYRSLHVAVDVSDGDKSKPLMEIQIRTTEMDSLAVGGAASHSLYKGGLTDPAEAKRLKAIILAAAEFAALRLRDVPAANHRSGETGRRDRVFCLLDKNGDGRISIDELAEVIEDLGAEGEDAQELMQLLDANSDGSLSSDEFDSFQRQVQFMRNMENKDGHYRAMLGEKLQMADSNGLIQVFRKEFGDRLAVT